MSVQDKYAVAGDSVQQHHWNLVDDDIVYKKDFLVYSWKITEKSKFEKLNICTIQTDGSSVDSIEFKDPWLVESDDTRPNDWHSYATPFSPGNGYGVFLNENVEFDSIYPVYSLKAPHYAATTDGIYVFTCWTASPSANASFESASSTETAVVFKSAGVTVTANYGTKVSNQANYTATIPSDETLTIPAGASIPFAGGFIFNVQGNLTVAGTADNMVTLSASNSSNPWKGFEVTLNSTVAANNHVSLSNCIIKNATNLIKIVTSDNKNALIEMQNCVITQLLYSEPEIVFEDDLDDGNILRYRNMHESLEDFVEINIDRCTFNGGKYLTYGVAELASTNITNTIFNGTRIKIAIDEYEDVTLNGNDFYSCVFGLYTNGWWDVAYENDLPEGYVNITSNPQFINSSGGDYRLKYTSPCIDKGSIGSTNDPDGTRADIGAYYFPQMTASGTISSDTTWYGKVTVTGDVTVASGAELTIDPGSEIAFNSGKKITVNGDIDVNGLANALVIFTRSDTASTSRTYWYGIKISSTGGFDFDYFEMYGASYGIYPYYAVGSNSVSYGYFSENYRGMYPYYCDCIQISNSSFIGNYYGINARYTDVVYVNQSTFTGNTYGIVDYKTYISLGNSTIQTSTSAGILVSNYASLNMNTLRESDQIERNNLIANNALYGVNISSNSSANLGVYLDLDPDIAGGEESPALFCHSEGSVSFPD